MRSSSAGRFATLLFFCAVIVQAYPGGHLVRSFIQSTSIIPSLDDGSTTVSSSFIHPSDSQTRAQVMTTNSMTSSATMAFSMSPVTMTTSAHLAMHTQGKPQELTKEEPLISLSEGGVYLDVSSDGNDVDYEEYDEDSCDGDYEDEYFHTRDVLYGSYSNTLDSIMSKLEEIHSLLQAKEIASPMMKRQYDDVLTQEQAYGNQGKHLTQEQKDSVMSLVKGINGYQATAEGVGNTDQTEAETWEQINPIVQSAPLSAVLTPSQIAELVGVLGLIQGPKVPKKPSPSTIGTQAGESASQVGWMTPGDGNIRDVGYTVGSSANMQKFATSAESSQVMLLTRLDELRQQERDLMQQLSMVKPAVDIGHSFRAISDDGYQRLTPEEQAELTSMLLAGEKANTTTPPSSAPNSVTSTN